MDYSACIRAFGGRQNFEPCQEKVVGRDDAGRLQRRHLKHQPGCRTSGAQARVFAVRLGIATGIVLMVRPIAVAMRVRSIRCVCDVPGFAFVC